MSKCHACSAPLRLNTPTCRYCGVRNDLAAVLSQPSQAGGGEVGQCPDCCEELTAVSYTSEAAWPMQRCESCYGLFLPANTLQEVLNGSSATDKTELGLIDQVNRERYQSAQTVRYRPCPICEKFMRRTAYGRRSGVIVDICAQHGVWLDNGELMHLLEWAMAGGVELPKIVSASADDDPRHRAAFAEAQIMARRERSSSLLNSGVDDVVEHALSGLWRILN